MRLQDFIADSAKQAAQEMFRYARSVPADKLDWAPEGGRSTMSMVREIGMTPTWTMAAFGEMEWNEDAFANQQKEMESWATVDACEEQFNQRFEAVDKFFREMKDEDFSKTRWLPYNGGRDHTFLEMTDYPRWNANYHTGQIAYIQILLGDKEMH